MSEQEKKVLMPALRFPEFRGDGDWVEVTIGDIGHFYYGKSAPKWSLEENAPTPCVRYGELYTRFGATITKTYSRTNIDPKKLRFSKGGEILVPRVGERPEEFGKCCSYLPLANIAIGEMISVFETTQNSLFYTYYFRNFYLQFAKVVEGQNVKNLYYAVLEPLSICRPSLPEQQKIADCLSSLDELISLQTQKVDGLKAHKKGLMQQLFPAEGETQPKLRFPEFHSEWVEETLGAVTDYENGKAHEQDIDTQGNYIVVNSKFISTEGEVKKFTNAPNLLASKGDILMVLSDVPNGRAIAKCFYVDEDNTYTVNQRICKLTSRNAVRVILFYLFDRNPYFLAFDDGVKQTNLKKDDVLKCPVSLPRDKEEQQKIADCLTSLDELITAQTKKIDVLKSHKKGLMQQLFPSMDEVGA